MENKAPRKIWVSSDNYAAEKPSGSWHTFPYGKGYIRENVHEKLLEELAYVRVKLRQSQLEAEKMRGALKAIAGIDPWPNPEMGFNDLARGTLKQTGDAND